MAGTTIYLVRHAIAEERGHRWPDDDLRPLTDEGAKRFGLAATGLGRFDEAPDLVATSPLVRARQTAELLSQALAPSPTIEVLDVLAPGHAPADALRRVSRLSGWKRLALVGHEPDLGHLAGQLLGTERPLPFKKGGMCRIDVVAVKPLQGALVWFLPPRALRSLAESRRRHAVRRHFD